MKFKDIPYRRITLEEIRTFYEKLEKEILAAQSEEEFFAAWDKRKQLRSDMTVMTICGIRRDCNVNDPFYAAEQKYYDEIGPQIEEMRTHLTEVLMNSRWKDAYRRRAGEFTFALTENSLKGFSPEIIPLMQEESELLNKYRNLTSNACVEWNGEQVPRDNMAVFRESTDRETRRKASEALYASWMAQREEIEEIYDRLIRNRNAQARALGYADYAEFSYVKMDRIGFGADEVKRFREHVKETMVQRYADQEDRHRQRLQLDHLYVYDEPVKFLQGNPMPQGDTAFCMEAVKKMFDELSPETARFIDEMIRDERYDVEIRKGKMGGGYMTTLETTGDPFIFANFDGTTENAYVMSHEGGHAFQGFLKKSESLMEHCTSTAEIAETHAMAMEFFCWPYMEYFFGDRAEDYRTLHLEGALRRILYQCEQDEFQQAVYEHPELTKKERNDLWLRLEKTYFPGRDFSYDPYLSTGCFWQTIPHFFYWPFYCIDYGLAQVAALEFHEWNQKDHEAAWNAYLTFCRETGKLSFRELLKKTGLKDIFE